MGVKRKEVYGDLIGGCAKCQILLLSWMLPLMSALLSKAIVPFLEIMYLLKST